MPQSNQKKSLSRNKMKDNTGFFKLLSTYYQKYWFSWLMLVSFTLVISGITVAFPKLINIIFEELSLNVAQQKTPLMPWTVLIYWVIGLGLALVFAAIFRFFQGLFGGRIARKIEINIRLKILNKLIDLDLAYYSDKKMGNLLTKLISDTQILGEQSYQIPLNFLNAVFTFIGSIVILFTLNNTVIIDGHKVSESGTELELAGIVMGYTFLIIIVTILLFSLLRKRIYKKRKVLTDINGVVTDRINALKLIKTSATINYEKNHFEDIHKLYYTESMNAVRIQAWITAIIITGLTSLNILSILIGIVFINQGKLNPSIMISFTMGINSLIMPIILLSRMLGNFASASTSAIRINEILIEKPTIKPFLYKTKIKGFKGDIQFKNVGFKYNKNEPYILKDFSFTFKANRSYAIVGESGVGKTTISQLLLRLYDPTEGQILIDNNKNLSKIDLKSYLDNVGYVEQEPLILFGNFLDNIRYGNFNATDEEIYAATKKANIYNFIMLLPKKFNTVLGEHGFILSGGQKQRVVIARMFLRNPRLLILDEATSSLDNIVENEIQKELNKLMKNKTTIIIAHRLSTIRNVDEILVLEKNKGIVQTGTFQTLINKKEDLNYYSKLD